ncbi:MAG: hypothetical protein ACKOS8_03785, partial [Gemmataceae bacterium]
MLERRCLCRHFFRTLNGDLFMSFSLPALPYAADSLEKAIDKTTMEIHHGRHHKAYVDNLIAALAGHDHLLAKPVDQL